jgi:hypothetical protein
MEAAVVATAHAEVMTETAPAKQTALKKTEAAKAAPEEPAKQTALNKTAAAKATPKEAAQ